MKSIITFLILIFTYNFQHSVFGQLTIVPTKVNQEKSVITLNGEWYFNASYKGQISSIKDIDNKWKSIKVPGEWKMQGFDVKPGEKGTYFRTFDIPEQWKGLIIFMRCDAVFSKAEIAVNGKTIESHTGPMMAFEREITSLVKFGNPNKIALAITAETMADTLMSATQYAAHQMGGILRKIYLYAVPKTYLSDLTIETDLDKQYTDAHLTIQAQLNNKNENGHAAIIARLFDPDQKEVLLQDNIKSFKLTKGQQPVNLLFDLTNPMKWDAEHPNLYRLELEVKSNAGTELISRQIGFRKIEITGNQVYVNGKPIKLKGVNRHEVHPLLGRSLTPELWEKDARIFKRGNVNYIRTSHYPPAEEFIEWCDKLGLYVEVENQLCWVGHPGNDYWKNHDFKNPGFYSYFEQVAKANISFLRNHASILMWSMANESKWSENWSKLADFYAKEDPTRPHTFHDQAYGDYNNNGSTKMPIANIHYPGPPGPGIANDFIRPLLIGEDVHLNTYNRREIVTDPGIRDAWGIGFEPMWNNMYYSRGCLGGAIWSGIDDVFMLPEGKAVGYGEWGPIDGWRREKPEYFHMKKIYSPVKIFTDEIKLPVSGNEIHLQAENRFDFTNFLELKIDWTIGNESGSASSDIIPRTYGVIRISPVHPVKDGESLLLKITSPLGYVIDEYLIPIGQQLPLTDGQIQKDELVTLVKSTEEILVKGESFEWIFDAQTGVIKQATMNRQQILKGGSSLMMLPLTSGPCLTEHSLNIQPLNNICANWKMSGISSEENELGTVIKVTGSYDEAEGSIYYTINHKGNLQITYQFKSKIDISPRQWGLVFTTPRKVEMLSWNRKGQWNSYPENHIGRNTGKALPYPENQKTEFRFGIEPAWDWRYDCNELGSNDFRSSKDFIYEASLQSKEGYGVMINGGGKQTFRAFVNGDSIQFLVTGFSMGGGDDFFRSHLEQYRRPLKTGDSFSGTVMLQLFSK